MSAQDERRGGVGGGLLMRASLRQLTTGQTQTQKEKLTGHESREKTRGGRSAPPKQKHAAPNRRAAFILQRKPGISFAHGSGPQTSPALDPIIQLAEAVGKTGR